MGIPKDLHGFERDYVIRTGHAKKSGATKTELDVLRLAYEILIKKYPITKRQEENLKKTES